MEFLTENKQLIIRTAVVVIVVLLLIKFFDVIFLGCVLLALGVGAMLAWNQLSKKHGGVSGVWKAFLKEIGS